MYDKKKSISLSKTISTSKKKYLINPENSNKGSSHNLPKITTSAATVNKNQNEEKMNVKNLQTEPSYNVINTSESCNSDQKIKTEIEYCNTNSTRKRNSLGPDYLIKLNQKMKLDSSTSLKNEVKKKLNLDTKNINSTFNKLAPKMKTPKESRTINQSNKVVNLKNPNFSNVFVLTTDSPHKNDAQDMNFVPRPRKNSISYNPGYLNSLNQSKDSNQSKLITEEKQTTEFYCPMITESSQGLSNVINYEVKNNFHSLMNSFNTELNFNTRNDSITPEKYKNSNIDSNNISYPNKNFMNVISKMKILLNEGNREDSPFFTKRLNLIQTNFKEEIDRELTRDMLFFEIDNVLNETRELHNNIKKENFYEQIPQHESFQKSKDKISSKELTQSSSHNPNVKTNSERRILIYKKIFEICGESMKEINNSLKTSNIIEIIENKTIITINNKENTKIENNTNNITNTVYNNNNKNSSNNVNLNLNVNLKTINQIPLKADRESNARKTLLRKSRKNTTKKHTQNTDNFAYEDCDDSMISEGVEINLPQSYFIVKKPKDLENNFRLYTEGDAINDVSINNENDFAYNISDSSGEDNNDNDMDNTIKIFNDEKEVTKSKKLRSKSLLHVPLIKGFREDRNGNKTKKLSGFPFIGIFNQISLAKVRIFLLTF
jgi:hypothetical protein